MADGVGGLFTFCARREDGTENGRDDLGQNSIGKLKWMSLMFYSIL
jgi:hypothetical protein